MKIKKLIVRKLEPSEETIREIQFNEKGLSLIVDNTTKEERETGNSIGKTTAIRIIDLCLGAKSVRQLYYDPDTGSDNKEVRDFLKKYKVQAELILIENEKEYSIKRDLYERGKRYIGDKVYSEKELAAQLKKMIFHLEESHPTFRQLVPKFVRIDNTSEDNMIQFLPKMRGDIKATYDTIYGFLFQLYSSQLLNQKSELNQKQTESRKIIQALEKSKSIASLSALKQSLEIIDTDLKELSDKREKLSYMDEYREELDVKRQLTAQINELQEQLELLEFEIDNMRKSISNLSKEKSEINFQTLKSIYQEAESFVPELQKSFEDMVDFHNSMIQNRIDFIREQLEKKEQRWKQYSEQLETVLADKKKMTVESLDEGLLEELNTLNYKIENLSQKKGEVVKSIEILEEQEKIYKNLDEQLAEIDIEAAKSANKIEEKLKKFNVIFSDYCNQLYGEKYLLSYNQNWKAEKKFPVEIVSIGGVLGTGKKKALIVAFDLAYMQYGIQMGLYVPQFVIHDKMENTHINQIKTIFKISNSIEGQYIMPILRERIDKVDQDLIEGAKVLELSEEDKFFRI